MNFQEIIDGITPKVSGDNADDVKAALKQLSVLYSDSGDKLKSFGSENKEKRGIIQALESKIRDFTENSETNSTKVNDLQSALSEAKAVNKGLSEFKAKQQANTRKSFADDFAKVTKHKNFDSAKSNFTIPEEKEGKLDWASVDDTAMDSNIEKLTEYNSLGLFGAVKTFSDGGLHGDATPDFNTRLANAKTPAELQEIQASIS